MSLSEQQMAFVRDISHLIYYANSLGVDLTFGEAYRTEYQQQEYVREGKSKTMNSNHLRRLAVDFNFFINGGLTYKHPLVSKIGDYWEKMNKYNRWGGNFTNFYDAPHFERNI